MPFCCPAKINLFLSIDGLLPGGYHALSTVMQKIGLCDELEAVVSLDGKLELGRDIPATSDPESDLVMISAKRLREYVKRPELGARLLLKKRIPTGAGLGGGSSDAAGTLELLNRLWKLDLKREELMSLAASIGSDVPFFLGTPASFCRGRGEILEKLEPREFCLLLAKPPESLPTKEVYLKYDETGRERPEAAPFLTAYEKGSWEEVGGLLMNSLEAPAMELCEAAKETKERLQALTPYVSMSGSGSAFFGLFPTLSAAAEAGSSLKNAYPDLTVCATKTLV